MRTVELHQGIVSSALGFGCAPILGSVDAARSRRALRCALEHGITHFDLARSYGYGDAERLVGATLRHDRSHIVLSSKFGIRTRTFASLLKFVKPLMRSVRGTRGQTVSSPSSGRPPSAIANTLLSRITPLRGDDMRHSVETSLAALKTDYLDYLFVHDPLDVITYIDELSGTALTLKQEGKVRAWGLAYHAERYQLHRDYLDRFDVQQFGDFRTASLYQHLVRTRSEAPNIVFSALSSGLRMGATPEARLQSVAADFPRSVILCSMFTDTHIHVNARLFR